MPKGVGYASPGEDKKKSHNSHGLVNEMGSPDPAAKEIENLRKERVKGADALKPGGAFGLRKYLNFRRLLKRKKKD